MNDSVTAVAASQRMRLYYIPERSDLPEVKIALQIRDTDSAEIKCSDETITVNYAHPVVGVYDQRVLDREVWRHTAYAQPIGYLAIEDRRVIFDQDDAERFKIGGHIKFGELSEDDLRTLKIAPQKPAGAARRAAAALDETHG